MATLLSQQIRARLSYDEIKKRSSFEDHVMINDYLSISQESLIQAERIDENTSSIEVNEAGIVQNALDIVNNASDIINNANNLIDHEADDSVHGVTGVVVGTEDYPTSIVGGAVLLSALVADAVSSVAEITLPDIASSPAAYSQSYQDSQTDMINDIKAKHNTLLADLNLAIVQFNLLIANEIAAKQMSAI